MISSKKELAYISLEETKKRFMIQDALIVLTAVFEKERTGHRISEMSYYGLFRPCLIT
jgi:hypothetical protein